MKGIREKTLLLGLWYEDKKPNANNFIYKFREALEEISNGIQVQVPRDNNIELKTVRRAVNGNCRSTSKK